MLHTLRLSSIPIRLAMSRAASCGDAKTPKVAVILSGCGCNDGSEIHEAVSVLSHLQRNNAEIQCFAPDMPQMHVIDHAQGKEESGSRNVLAESARISRGNIWPLQSLICSASEFQAVIVPGGFGVAKNLSDFATKQKDLTIQRDVCEALECFVKSKKPIGFVCIAPILAAKLIPGVTITLGKSDGDKWPHKGAIEVAKALGANVEEKGVLEVSIDRENKIFSTPAFMYDGGFHEVDDGIGNLVAELMEYVK